MAPLPLQPPPEPPPIPPAPPVAVTVQPDPPATVIVNPPPEVHDWANWWYENGATVGGAGVAIVTAVVGVIIAFRVVSRQIDASKSQMKDQIDANAAQVQRQIDASAEQVSKQIAATEASVAIQIDAEKKNQRRTERVALVTEAYDLVHSLFMPSGDIKAPTSPEEEEQLAQAYWREQNFKVNSIVTRFNLLGMDDEARAVADFREAAFLFSREPFKFGPGVGQHQGKYLKTLDLLKRAIDD
jgi:hypothetical protein